MKTPVYVVGIDEVGRGPLAGPVTVCACMVPGDFDMGKFAGIRDSKKLTPKKREEWFVAISAMKERGELDFAFTSIPAGEIDAIGIAVAIQKALDTSLAAVASAAKVSPSDVSVMLDGSLHAPATFIHQETIIKGDEKIPVISAASIVAKVTRDRFMDEMAVAHPGYGLERHKGYGTAAHCAAIRKLGPSPIHRRSFLRNFL
ncbi:MAG: ribonuclease HII [Candidatus Paceibacterota bacterium]